MCLKTKDKELKSRNSRLMKTSSTAKSHLFDSKNDNKNPLTDKQRAREEYRIEYRFESKLESKADTDANHAIRLKERGYDIIGGGVVRRGVFSKVFSVVRQTDGQTMGCKAIQNREICESLSLFKEVKWEIIMTNATNSPRFMHLIRYFNAFIYDRKYAYILMEECPTGQSLQTRLSARADGFPEEEAAVYFRQIALAINYLHIQTIAHRNLKLDNVLIFKTPDGRDLLKVTDYCLNRVSKKSDRVVVYERDAKRIIYMSPQILKFYAKHLRKTIRERGIRGILTVMDEPLAPKEKYNEITYHYIEADDYTDQDLLTRFVDAYDIIGTYTRAKTGVLVHCAAGISRSATIVISYLMRELRMTFAQTMTLVRTGRPIISPNEGFQRQLSLYEWMGCRLDANDRRFRQYLLKMFVPSDCRQLSQYFERLLYVENSTANLQLGPKYVCKECGQKLFHEIHVLKNANADQIAGNHVCGRVFIEPQRWISELLQSNHSTQVVTIKCQKCAQPVATFVPQLQTNQCNCKHHANLNRLKIQMLDNKYAKSQSNQ
ncbi:unnamed protein product [Medioppia subpectinata]|uniref:protein-tyrosine-phosphatase n=1 Tax=Medioppia subpectinata TaxID=1979941 RepID=A0A7R9KN62_9ACAR|nr:unnamed protein product [Medioppia subpectinata]CAG2105501.1 unnamed protein product [Medioppia subpectinata]